MPTLARTRASSDSTVIDNDRCLRRQRFWVNVVRESEIALASKVRPRNADHRCGRLARKSGSSRRQTKPIGSSNSGVKRMARRSLCMLAMPSSTVPDCTRSATLRESASRTVISTAGHWVRNFAMTAGRIVVAIDGTEAMSIRPMALRE